MSKTVWNPSHIKDHKLPDVTVPPRGRGRPRKNPDALAHDQKKRGSQTSHGPEHYAEIRYRRSLAGIMHKQFRILAEDEAEAERLMSKLLDRANAAYHEVSVLERKKIEREAKSRPVDLSEEIYEGPVIEFTGLNPSDGFQESAEPDVLDDLEPVTLPQEPPTASLLEEKREPPPEPAAKPKPIRERGKLILKAFRKDAP